MCGILNLGMAGTWLHVILSRNLQQNNWLERKGRSLFVDSGKCLQQRDQAASRHEDEQCATRGPGLKSKYVRLNTTPISLALAFPSIGGLELIRGGLSIK